MKLLKKIIYWKLSLKFYFITYLRNKLYDFGIKRSYSFKVPVISVGNLVIGGTGKTPMVEFLINSFSQDYKIGILSRGYKRKSRGFILASAVDDANSIGDEPFQYFSKFKNIKVAVDKKRRRGINKLMNFGINLIILDDAFQHRKVIPAYSILLTEYSNLYFNDYLLPRGNLRESRYGSRRADTIVVTKCPENISKNDKKSLLELIKPSPTQTVFFSKIKYSENIFSETKTLKIRDLHNKKINIVTGIADSSGMIEFLTSLGIYINHFSFADHHNYSKKDVSKFSNQTIITTEKDYTKLRKFGIENLYYLPISFEVLDTQNFLNTIEVRISQPI